MATPGSPSPLLTPPDLGQPPTFEAIAGAARRLFLQHQRADLAELAAAAVVRSTSDTVILAVLGEFKQGKSSLVNGLLGEQVAPVDDDLATALPTIFRYGEE